MFYRKLNRLPSLKMLVVLVMIIGVSGCNTIKKTISVVVPFYSYDKTSLSAISITADADSNTNMPVAIDFIFIYQAEKII